MEEVKKYLRELGYEERDIEKIISNYALRDLKSETLLNNIKRNYECLISIGYSEKDIREMTKRMPPIYGYSIETIKKKIEDMVTLGYDRADVIEMTKSLPQIYSYSIETIKKKIEDMVALGYRKEDVINMTKRMPPIYGLSIENIKKKIEDMVALGYREEDVINMTKSFPSIYNYSIETIKQKIEAIESLGYSRADVIEMTKGSPQIYGYSIENIKQKIGFYDSINLHSLAVMNPKYLMQSTALSYARYMFYRERGIGIDETNYQKLFISQKRFERQYGAKKEDLLAKYNYAKFLKSQREAQKGTVNTQELGKQTVQEQENTQLIDGIENAQNEHQEEKESKNQEEK